MARYLGKPLIGISPKPKVVNVFIESIKALSILMIISYNIVIRNAPINRIDFPMRLDFGRSLHLPCMISTRFRSEADTFVPETAHL